MLQADQPGTPAIRRLIRGWDEIQLELAPEAGWGLVAVGEDLTLFVRTIRNGHLNLVSAKTYLRLFVLNLVRLVGAAVGAEDGGMTIQTATGTFPFDYNS